MSFQHNVLGGSLTKPLLTAGLLLVTIISTTANTPKWIWNSKNAKDGEKVFFRKKIRINKETKSANLTMSCDNGFEAFVNG